MANTSGEDSSLPSVLATIAEDPMGWFRSRLVQVILGYILTAVTGIADAVRAAFDSVIQAIEGIGGALGAAGGSIGTAFGTVVELFVTAITTVGDAMGPLEPVVYSAVIVAVAVVGYRRVLPAALAAGSDLLGAIPVVGSLLDAIVTFLTNLRRR